jgi:hypothetical protein
MVVPSGLADSLNAPSLMGVMGATGLVPHQGNGETPSLAGSASADPVKEPQMAHAVEHPGRL